MALDFSFGGGQGRPISTPPLPPAPSLGGAGATIARIMSERSRRKDVARERAREEEADQRLREARMALVELSQDEDFYQERKFRPFELDPYLSSLTRPTIDDEGNIVAPPQFADEDGNVDLVGLKQFVYDDMIGDNFTPEDAEAVSTAMVSLRSRRVYSDDFGRKVYALGMAAGMKPSDIATVLEGTVEGGASIGEDDFREDMREEYLNPLLAVQRRQVGRTEQDARFYDPDQEVAYQSAIPFTTGEKYPLTRETMPSKWGLSGEIGERFNDPEVWSDGVGFPKPSIGLVQDESAPLGWRIEAEWFNEAHPTAKKQAQDLKWAEGNPYFLLETLINSPSMDSARDREEARRAAFDILSKSPKFSLKADPKAELELPSLRKPWKFLTRPDGMDEGAKAKRILGPNLSEYDR